MTLDMKSSLIVMMISLSLVGSISNSYAEVGDFITSFEGSGGTVFVGIVAVDNNDNIIVADATLRIVQIYDPNGVLLTSFEGSDSSPFIRPYGLAVDSNDRIIVVDSSFPLVQVFDSNGLFDFRIYSLEGGATAFIRPYGLAVDNNDRIIVSDASLNLIQVFDSNGLLDFSFDGSGGILFVDPFGVTTDSNNRIIVSDYSLNLVQVFDHDGNFITSINGSEGNGTAFSSPFGLTVDSNDNIIVSDTDLGIVQIYDPNGVFITSFNGSDGTVFVDPFGVAVDSNNRIIVADASLNLVQIFDGFTPLDPVEDDIPVAEDEPVKKSGKGGCADCTSPTLGLNSFYKRVVDDGFSYNGNSVQVGRWHTPYPLINATVGETNTVEVIVYENQGVNNMKLVQFGLGATEIGQPLTQVEVLIMVDLNINSNNFEVKEIIINDKDNLIENSSVVAVIDMIQCTTNSQNETCLKVTLQYSYREPTIYNIMIVNVRDKPGNSQNFYLNEGIQVVGESMNPVPYVTLDNRKTKQQTEDLTIALFRADKWKDIWIDGKGIEYHRINDNWFDRITPTEAYKCTDPPVGAHGDRNNCNFRNLTELWTYE